MNIQTIIESLEIEELDEDNFEEQIEEEYKINLDNDWDYRSNQ